jgi:phosphoserine phosphatase RsbU/P
MKVLAIEDQPIAAMNVVAALRALGHEPVCVRDGAAAWDELARNHYRVIVSDWRMPGIDGLQLCEMIRAKGGEYVYFILVSVVAITRDTQSQSTSTNSRCGCTWPNEFWASPRK